MSAEIESLSTDQNARRPGQGVSPMIVAMAVIALLGAIYAHWRLAQFDDRVDRVRRQIAGLHETQARIDAHTQSLAAELEASRNTWRNELRGLRELPLVVPGERVAAAAGELGWRGRVVAAASAEDAAMLQAVVTVADGSAPGPA